ncbi:hypothetical protein SNEBB_007364 [Seison nebaliae]|nr:hypothetical protein SNEBB_007364 [Seison nebaliae]
MQSINSALINSILLMYNFLVVWILLTMFIAILNDTHTKVRNQMENEENQYELLQFLSAKMKTWLGLDLNPDDHGYPSDKRYLVDGMKYSDQIKIFPRKVDELLIALNKDRNKNY